MKHKLKRIAASVLTLALLAVPALAAAENVGSSTLNVANNTVYTYSTQAVTSDSGKQTNLHENIFTYKKEAQVRPVVAFGTTLYGTSPMNKTIKTLEEQGYSMVAGINGSFFDRSTGIPYGMVVTNSILRSGGSANAVGFLADGSALIGDPVVAVTLDYGADTPLLLNYNKAMTTQNGVLLYSQDYDTRTKNTIEGYHVIVRPVGSRAAELRLGQTLTVEVVGMVEDTKSCSIPDDGFLLAVANDTAYKSALTALKSMVMGQQMTIQVTCASGWENVTSAAGGGDMLVENGQVCTDFTLDSAKKMAARTAIGVTRDGSLILYTCDEAGNSDGLTLAQLAERMLALGCQTALNLDGGGRHLSRLRLRRDGERAVRRQAARMREFHLPRPPEAGCGDRLEAVSVSLRRLCAARREAHHDRQGCRQQLHGGGCPDERDLRRHERHADLRQHRHGRARRERRGDRHRSGGRPARDGFVCDPLRADLHHHQA